MRLGEQGTILWDSDGAATVPPSASANIRGAAIRTQTKYNSKDITEHGSSHRLLSASNKKN